MLWEAWMNCVEGSALAEGEVLNDHNADILVAWFNLLQLGICRLSVPLYTQLQGAFSSIPWQDHVNRFLNFGFFSPRLLQSCNVGPENWSGSPWRTCENESSSCGRADGKTWSHVEPSGVTLVYMLVHWHSSSRGNWQHKVLLINAHNCYFIWTALQQLPTGNQETVIWTLSSPADCTPNMGLFILRRVKDHLPRGLNLN